MMEAVCPTNEATRDSLELWVFLNMALNIQNTPEATTPPPTMESGALAQTLAVVSILLKMRPNAPKAVTKLASTVGLKNESPGTPLWS